MLIDGLSRQAGRCAEAARITILTGCLLSLFPAAAETQLCGNPNVEIRARTSELRNAGCTAAQLALEFLSRYGLQAHHPVRISIVEQPLHNPGYSTYGSYGSYDSRSDLVQVMSPQAIRLAETSPQMYDQPLDRAHYRGIIAHEVAHALVQQNSHVSPRPVGAAAQEYLACVTQLSVLPAERREQLIRSADIGPWKTGDVISTAFWSMAPHRFAVKSYLHFDRQTMPAIWVDELLGSKSSFLNVK